ncbi:oxidoreductase 2OG-Fe(II) oxygenase family protein [Rutstroemia sp. NJR-2017a BBW]|nr:oxidoreductase 2OG-Fe(II) oxygenase family protein [Rutstroemia sp. NJR-2017a BBW]
MERIKEYDTEVTLISFIILTLSTRWEISKSTPPCPASQCHDVRNLTPLFRAMNFGDFVDGKAQQPLPPSLAPHESELDEFQQYCHKLCLKILTLFAIGLEIDPAAGGSSWFASRHHGGPTGCILRLLHYPSIPADSDYQPDVDIRAGAHSDYGSITLLFQRPSQPGLEILPPSSSPNSPPQWTPVPISPHPTTHDPSPPILVNIGDLLSHWTNNLLKSTVHRVIFPTASSPSDIADRYSIAYFCHPVGSTVLESVPSERVRVIAEKEGKKGNEGKEGKKITADEHLMGRLRATYLGMYGNEEKKEEVEK